MNEPPAPSHGVPLLALNGKFTAQRTTGVQRHAAEVLRALDALLLDSPGHVLHAQPPVLYMPAGAPPPRFALIRVRACPGPVQGLGAIALHLWEQWTLPRMARGGLLLSLAGSSPAWGGLRVVTLHDAALWDHPQAYGRVFRAWYRWLFGRQARHAAALLTVSRFSQGRLAQALGLPLQRLSVVPGGSGHLQGVVPDERILTRLGVERGRYFVAVASSNPTKNLARLVQAHADAGAALPPLVLVGGASPGVFASPPVTEAGGPGLRMAGTVSDAELKALLAHALALVCPSLYEGFGLPVLEAMDCACPVLAARAASLPEVAGSAALYADPTDAGDLAAGLGRLAADGPLRASLREAGLRRSAALPWADSARALLAVLEPLLPVPARSAA
jgi:glycosyltransferase involved in cell wall biosynthesis